MQITEHQLEIIKYSMLSEPGDALAHLIFENFGPEIASRTSHPEPGETFRNTWPSFILNNSEICKGSSSVSSFVKKAST
jgi:hypothetical protein